MIDVSVSVPEYGVDKKPDGESIGQKIDQKLWQYFSGHAVIRCLSLQDHPNITLEQLVEQIKKTGFDKYDAEREGVGYPKDKEIDFFGLPADLDSHTTVMAEFIDDFYESAFQDRGQRLRIDLVLVYDPSQLNMVKDIYEGHAESDAFTFKDPTNKLSTLLGILRIQ